MAVPAVILTAVIIIAAFRVFPLASHFKPDNNPDKFYLWTTGNTYSFTYTYDPHAADLWMFRTAEGHLLPASNQADGGMGVWPVR